MRSTTRASGAKSAASSQPAIVPFTLVSTMTASSFQIFVFAVLATRIKDDLGVTITQLGVLGSINTVVGALTAPMSGRITDLIGPRRSILLVLLISGTGLVLTALSTSLWILVLASTVSGVPQGWGNPATNALISTRVAEGSKGVLTGIKQSGVQVGIFLAGLTLPTLAEAVSWQGAMWVYAGLCFVLALIVWLVLDADPGPPDGAAVSSVVAEEDDGEELRVTAAPTAKEKAPINPFILRVATYALFMGLAAGAASRFFAVWAEEVIGFSNKTAGVIIALGGLLGIVVRISIGRFAERSGNPSRLLGQLALVGAAYFVVLMVTERIGSWILWPSPILMATGVAAWNAVAMLAVILTVPRAEAGRASGVVMVGFLGGLSIGPPFFGYLIDQTGSYQPLFVGCFLLALLSSAVTLPGSAGRAIAR